MLERTSWFKFALFFFVVGVPAAWCQDGFRGLLSDRGQSQEFVAADFDKDPEPDGATLSENGVADGKRAFRIEVHITAGNNSTIHFSAAEPGLLLTTVDVNRDGAPDLVVEKPFTHEPVQVYLNNGRGEFYTAGAQHLIPSDNGTQWRSPSSPASFPTLFLPATRAPEIVLIATTDLRSGQGRLWPGLWLEALLVHSAARAPSSARAPPILSF